MGNIFFIGDTHFGSKTLILSPTSSRSSRFSSVEEQDQTIEDNWNKTVRTKDVVYHVGDVSMGNIEVLKRLRGYKKLILGNHDNWNKLAPYFDRCYGAFKFQKDFILTHIPVN